MPGCIKRQEGGVKDMQMAGKRQAMRGRVKADKRPWNDKQCKKSRQGGIKRQAGHLKRKAMECKKTGKGEVINKQGSRKNRQNGSIKNKNKKGGENRQASCFVKRV
jgi:hypothetical protein